MATAFPSPSTTSSGPDGTNGASPPAPGSLSASLFGPPQLPPDPVAERLKDLDPIDFSIQLDDEASRRLAHRICGLIESYHAANRRRADNLNFWRLAYEMMPPGTSNRWENSADTPSPLTRIACNGHHTKLNQQLGGTVPPFAAVARTPEAMEATTLIEDCMTSVLDQANWPQVMDDKNRELVIAGNVFIRTTYEREYARLPKKKVDINDDTFDGLLRAGADMHDAAGHAVERVRFGHEEELLYDGVKFKVIKWEDGIILPAMIRDPKEAYGIGERLTLSGFDLLAGVRDGIYFEEAVDELLKLPGDPQPQDRLQREEEQGRMDVGPSTGALGDPDDALYRPYEIYELCWKMVPPDEAGDDRPSRSDPVWTVIHLHFASRKIIGHQYLQYEHGRPYYALERYILRTNELWAMSVPELLASIQDADTAIQNQQIDYHDWSLNMSGNFWYTGLSGYDPDKTILQIGRPIKVEDLNEIKPMEAVPPPMLSMQLRQKFKDDTDLLTATSNPSLGKTTDSGRTLGEVQIVTSAAHSIFEDYANRVARQDAERWDEARWLTAQYGLRSDAGRIRYRRTAAPDTVEFAHIDPDDLSANVDLVPSGLQQLSDMGSRTQQATLVLAQIQHSPITVGNIEAQVLALGEYLDALKYPIRQKMMGAIMRGVQAQMAVQQAELAHAAMGGGAPMGPEGPGAPGAPPDGSPGAAGPAPPGSIGGAPAPIPAPPELPPGATTQQTLPEATTTGVAA